MAAFQSERQAFRRFTTLDHLFLDAYFSLDFSICQSLKLDIFLLTFSLPAMHSSPSQKNIYHSILVLFSSLLHSCDISRSLALLNISIQMFVVHEANSHSNQITIHKLFSSIFSCDVIGAMVSLLNLHNKNQNHLLRKLSLILLDI